MIKNPKALMTLVRNKITVNLPLEEKMKWFHEKGITVIQEGDLYYLKSDPRGHISELTDVCNNVIFHGHHLVAFPGWPVKEVSFTQLKENKKFILDETTVFVKPIDEGHTIYMFWDLVDEKWRFASQKKINSPHEKIVVNKIKNIMAGEYCYTYTLKLVEGGDNTGLYIESIFNHQTFKEEDLGRVISFAKRFDIKYPDCYILEKENQLEKSDLPVIIRDISGHKFKINEI